MIVLKVGTMVPILGTINRQRHAYAICIFRIMLTVCTSKHVQNLHTLNLPVHRIMVANIDRDNLLSLNQ